MQSMPPFHRVALSIRSTKFYINSVCRSVSPSVTLLDSVKTVRDSALVTMGS